MSDAYSTLKDMGVTKSDVKNIFEKAIEFIKGDAFTAVMVFGWNF